MPNGRSRRLMLCAWMLVATSCTSVPSRIVVVIDTDFDVPARLDTVVVHVTTSRSGPRPEVRLPLGTLSTLPLSVVIEQAEGGRGNVEVAVEGWHAGVPVIRHLVRTGFVAGRTVALDVFLARACGSVVCETDATCVPCLEADCASTYRCGRREVPPEDLRPILGPGDELDAGLGRIDAPFELDARAPDASRDAGRDAGRDSGRDVGTDGPPMCPFPQVWCDGRCRDLGSDHENCGVCGRTCLAMAACMGGMCTSGGCALPLMECPFPIPTCVNVSSDSNNCGSCGRPCGPGGACLGGMCVCPTGTEFCPGGCTDLASDPNNCGSCGRLCAAGGACLARACTCPPGTTDCAGMCVDLASSRDNCGMCGTACNPGAECLGMMCSCPPGTMDCGTGCTTGLMTDTSNCGTCGRVCGPVQACVAGECVCPAGGCGPPPPPVAPHDGLATGSSLTRGRRSVIFRWGVLPGASSYELQRTDGCASVAACTADPSPFVAAPLPVLGNSVTVPEDDFLPLAANGTRHYWRVRACYGASCEGWSAIRYVDVSRLRDDVNGDGYSDVVVSGRSGGGPGADTVLLFTGGPVTLTMSDRIRLGDLSISLPATLGEAVALADVDGDGYSDVLALTCSGMSCATSTGRTLWTWRSTGPTGVLAPGVAVPLPPRATGTSVSDALVDAGDVNGDGFRDVAFNTAMGWAVLLGAPTLAARTIEMTTAVSAQPPTGDCDLDLDGQTDLVFNGGSPGVLIWHYADPMFEVWNPMTPVPGAVTCGDLNRDGFADIAVADPPGSSVIERLHEPGGWREVRFPVSSSFPTEYDRMRIAQSGRPESPAWIVLAAPNLPLLLAHDAGATMVISSLPPGGRVLGVAQDPFGRADMGALDRTRAETILIGIPDGGSVTWLDSVTLAPTTVMGATYSLTLFGTAVARLELRPRLLADPRATDPWLSIYGVLSPG